MPDHERPLNARGRRDAPRIGAWLAGHVPFVSPAHVVVSSAARTVETWQRAAAELPIEWNTAGVVREPAVYEASTNALLTLIRSTPLDTRLLIVVGHNPASGELVARLDPDAAPNSFPTSAVAVLDVTGKWADLAPDSARLRDFVVPRG